MFTKDSVSSLNTYGYSPHPLSTYLQNVESILSNAPPDSSKPIIISITSTLPTVLASMMDLIQALRNKLNDHSRTRIAVELNTSCPNISGKSPPAYDISTLRPLLQVFADYFSTDPTLTLGLKLPPYTYSTQFEQLVNSVAEMSGPGPDGRRTNPIAFFTSTNTLGNTLLYPSQTMSFPSETSGTPGFLTTHPSLSSVLPAFGGLAGDSLHPLSLGNVYTLTTLLKNHGDEAMRDIVVIGVGGVTSYEAAERMRSAGAGVVGLATLLGREGLRAFEIVSRP